MIRRLTCLLACIAPIAFGGCIEEADDTDTDTPSIRETGYLTCSTADDACSAGQLSCYGPDGAVACVDPPPECGADGPDCACAGTTVCGTRACAERGDELVCGSGRQDAAPDPPADMGAPLDMSLDVPDAVIVPDVAVGDGSVVLCPEHEQAACENDPACGWRDGACVVSGEAAPFVAPTSVDFGAVPLGTTKTLDVTFEARDGFFQVSALGMSLDPAAFAVIVFDPAGGGPLGGIGEGVGELPLPLRVAEGRRLRIQLRFAPANVGQIVGDVQVGVGDFGVVTVPIAGRGE